VAGPGAGLLAVGPRNLSLSLSGAPVVGAIIHTYNIYIIQYIYIYIYIYLYI